MDKVYTSRMEEPWLQNGGISAESGNKGWHDLIIGCVCIPYAWKDCPTLALLTRFHTWPCLRSVFEARSELRKR